MANCCICSSKIAPNIMNRPLSEAQSDFVLCFTCYNMKLKLNSSDKTEQITSLSYFKNKIKEGLYDPSSMKALQSILSKCEPAKAETEKRNPIKEYNERMQNFLSTTTERFEGYKIQKYLGVVSGDISFETAPAPEADSPAAGRASFSARLMEAREDAYKRLKLKCVKRGANAVVGVHVETITSVPDMVIVIAEGTAVIIEKET